MTNEQRDQQPQSPSASQPNPRREFVKKAALTALGAAVSATVRAAWSDFFGGEDHGPDQGDHKLHEG